VTQRDQRAQRPELNSSLAEDEFRRWYWTLAELQVFARRLGVAASGRKADVSDRIAAALAGRVPPATSRPSTVDQLVEPLTTQTVIPEGQRSTQSLRRFFEAEIGSAFRFNGHMRSFVTSGGATLGDAIDHWHATVGTPLPPQSESLEFNQFLKAWHRAHGDSTAADARAAWQQYRALPVDQRPPIAEA